MKNLKMLKIGYCFFILFGFLWYVAVVQADDVVPSFDFAQDLNDPSADAFLDNTEFKTTKAINPVDVLQILLDFKAPCLLAHNLYTHTYPLNKKSIIDVPAFFPYQDYKRKSTFGMSLFLNQTWRMFFNSHCDGIQAYMAVCSPTLLQRMSECVQCVRPIAPNFNIDPMTTFPLFRNIAVQDRQVGTMFHGDKQFKSCNLHVHVPVLYQERNYYMTQDERDCIEKAFGAVVTPSSCGAKAQAETDAQAAQCLQQSCSDSPSHVGMKKDKNNPVDMAFVQNHLIGDQFGIGDTRIHLDWDLIRRHYYNLAFGMVVTVPTAFAFKKGLFGSSYENSCVPKDFNIANVVALASSGDADAATALGQAVALGALDQMSRNLLDTSLGYGKHLGLGLSYKTMGRLSYIIKRPWAHNVKMRSRMILQYYFPGTEMRAFVEDKNPADYSLDAFDRDSIDTDPVYAQEKLDFINRKFIEELYPFRFRTQVRPGFIFQSTSGYYYESRAWKIQLVTDFWARTGEDFGTICIPPGTPPLAIACAKRPAAYQSRMGCLVAYSIPCVSSTWTISLYGDKTYWSSGIGKDLNIVFNVECNF